MRRGQLAVVAVSIVCLWAAADSRAQVPQERDFKDIARWTTEHPVPGGAFADGVLTVTETTGWVRAETPFRDVIVRFEVLAPPTTKQAVLVVRGRTPAGATPGSGFALRIAGDTTATPTLPDMRLEAPSFNPDYLAKALNPAGDWQEYEILCEGDLVTVTLNGLVIFSERRLQEAEGWIGILSQGGSVAVRNIRSQPVQAIFPPGFRRIEVAADQSEVQIEPWLPGFAQELLRRWPRPREAKSMKGRVEVTLSVQKNGTISDVVVKPSPVDAFNKAARDAIAKATPESLPARYPNAQAAMTVVFFNNEYPAPAHATGIYRNWSKVVTPRLLRQVAPRPTREAMQANIHGTVVLDCVINADGTVGDVRVIRPLELTLGLEEEAVKAVKQWQFVPGTRLGQPVAVLARCEMEFNLSSGQR